MAELRLTDASHKALEERLKSPEGRDAMSRLTRIIVESVVEHFPPDLLRSLDTPEGQAAFREAWPDIVDAFLFRRPPSRKAPKSARKAKGKSRKASSQPRATK
jgi:hypothetical protein